MNVNKTIETANGNVVFEGELEQGELDLVIRIGLNYLMQMGALPFVAKGQNIGNMEETPDQTQ